MLSAARLVPVDATEPLAVPARLPSLGRRVLRRVLVPLALSWIAGTVVAVAIAQVFAQRAFDRSLLDDAFVLATHVRLESGQVRLNLTPREVNTVLFDQAETVFFAVRGPDGALIGGHPGLRMRPAEGDKTYRFEDIAFNGRLLRAVTLHEDHPRGFDVTVAQTTTFRDAMLRQLLLYSLLPQALLLTLLAAWLRRCITDEIQPLAALESAVEDRGGDDLAPVRAEASTHEVQSLGLAINALLARLEGSVRAQREFAGNVAHELRTPLAGIRALADYGLAQLDPAVWREQLAKIAASEARASAIVDKLLAIALVQEAQGRVRLVPLRLDTLVRAAVLRFLARADAQQVDLGARGAEGEVWIRGDETLVEGILDNLIDNALRYGRPPAGQPASVTVCLEAAGERVLLSVQDNGEAAPADEQARLLARGVQGDIGQLLGQGAGLGLALVAQYARLMRGQIALRTDPHHGWICEVSLPGGSPPPQR